VDEAHERYEALAVGHVLGGLAAVDAAAFRDHLLGCRDCRLRVAELRDIAADLAAAEREERADARVRTEVARRTAEAATDAEAFGDDGRGPTVTARHLGIGALVIIVAAGLLAFWNLHLRTQVAAVTSVVERQEATLSGVAGGLPVATVMVDSTRGLVTVDDDRVAFALVELPTVTTDERVVVWLTDTDEDGDVAVLVATAEEGELAAAVERRGADELVITAQTLDDTGDGPGGRELVRADLDAPAAAG
jgi:hypothetical protein